jgi:hypothetical protein
MMGVVIGKTHLRLMEPFLPFLYCCKVLGSKKLWKLPSCTVSILAGISGVTQETMTNTSPAESFIVLPSPLESNEKSIK